MQVYMSTIGEDWSLSSTKTSPADRTGNTLPYWMIHKLLQDCEYHNRRDITGTDTRYQ